MAPQATSSSLGLDDVERSALAAAAVSTPALPSQVCGVKAYPAAVERIRRLAADSIATVAALAIDAHAGAAPGAAPFESRPNP